MLRRRGWWLIGIVLLAITAATIIVIVAGHRSSASEGDTATVAPDHATRLRIPGIALDIPSGAVESATKAHLRPATPTMLSVPDQMAALFNSGGPAFTVDLSGQEPLKPISVIITIRPVLTPVTWCC